MIYLGVGIAVVIIGGISYLIYRKRGTQPDTLSEEEASGTDPASSETAPEVERAAPPLVSELSSLPEDAKNKLLNAVWYRCENPDCRYTKFLDVHHIISEIDGGSNRLDNLIVLCSKCHAAAHSHEIPEEELESWIRERTERLKYDVDWPYK